ncbi:MAG: hypothetical protein HOK57_04765 [Planctomycetaceae bacterium]|nr:hypothetical protein [Planctomycetaceae bacterium]
MFEHQHRLNGTSKKPAFKLFFEKGGTRGMHGLQAIGQAENPLETVFMREISRKSERYSSLFQVVI